MDIVPGTGDSPLHYAGGVYYYQATDGKFVAVGVGARPALTSFTPIMRGSVATTPTWIPVDPVPAVAPEAEGKGNEEMVTYDGWKLLTTAAPHLKRVLLTGPPGTGKSHLAMRAGLENGERVYRVPFTEDTPAAEVRGHYVPVGAAWEWRDGPGMLAYRHGGRLVADEITRASDDTLSFMLFLLDDPESSQITLPTGETVRPHANFTCWATTNDGPKALSDALADRFPVKLECSTVNPTALRELPEALGRAVANSLSGGPHAITHREAREYLRLITSMAEPRLSHGEAAFLVWGKRGNELINALKIAWLPRPSAVSAAISRVAGAGGR